jgi:hypothetical protein
MKLPGPIRPPFFSLLWEKLLLFLLIVSYPCEAFLFKIFSEFLSSMYLAQNVNYGLPPLDA